MTAIVLTLFVGLVSSLITSRLLAHPVSQLSAEVAVAQKNREKLPTLSRTGIRELDQFSQAITQLSQDILTTSTKFLRIMEMASIELGGYEMRFDLNTVYVTKNFFPMLNLPSEDVSELSTRYFQQMLREFDQTHSHTVWVGHSKVYEISFSDGTIRYIRMETSREGYAQIGLVEDFTSVMLERQRMAHERDYDALTGLYNRRAFQRESEALFEHSEVLGHAALLMIDLDNLKHTNDTFGHDWGDAYIRQAGQCFISSVPAKTLCARISGNIYRECSELLDWAFSSFADRPLVDTETVLTTLPLTKCRAEETVELYAANDLSGYGHADDEVTFDFSLPESAAATIKEGAVLGTATVYLDGYEMGTVDLVTHREYVSDFRTDAKTTLLLMAVLVGILIVLGFLTMVAGGGSLNLRRRNRSRRR